MMHYTVLLEASAPELNIWRSYHIASGQDIFGAWVVELTYGRIGAKGRKKTILVPDEAAAQQYVRQCLKKRETAPKRIGIGYKVRHVSGSWNDDSEANEPIVDKNLGDTRG